MNNVTARQRYLYLSAKLYALAAEFTDTELAAMLHAQSRDSQTAGATIQVIRALIKLHRSSESYSRSETQASEQDEPGPPSRQASSLLALFDDKSAFPSVANIASVVDIPARSKEARDRYVARVTRQVDAMSKKEQAEFFDGLAARLQKQPESFISKWSKVIQGT
jgi:hypothetical protein